jgi:dTDP-4-dehydrorhamnose 3,5-epimerase
VTVEDWRPTTIEGVVLRRNVERLDERGSFTELWRASLTRPLTAEPMVQANLSHSHAGVLRGMHFHLRQADLWMLVEGTAVAAVTDVRPALRGGRPTSEIIEMSVGDALFIPAQVAHGFLALTDMALVYLVSNEYDGTDEHGFAWNDPDAAISWPATPEIISDRDRANPTLRELITTLGQDAQIEGA